MSDETVLPPAGDETTPDPVSDDKITAKELERARREAATYRTKLRETESQLKELQPLVDQFRAAQDAQKTDAQKAIERAAELERRLAEQETAAAAAQRQAALTKLATKAGVDPDLVDYLDTSKLDLDDEKSTLAVLAKLATRAPAAGSNPSRDGSAKPSADELRAELFGNRRGRTSIFGG